jgi:hypothetical protein
MAENWFWGLLSGFILVSLFGLLILTSTVDLGNTYGKNTSEIAGGSSLLEDFNESISDIQSDAERLEGQFEKQSIWSSIAGLVVEGIFGVAKDMIQMILLPFKIVSNIMLDIFNIPAYVTSVILGLLFLAIIFAVWQLLKVGN